MKIKILALSVLGIVLGGESFAARNMTDAQLSGMVKKLEFHKTSLTSAQAEALRKAFGSSKITRGDAKKVQQVIASLQNKRGKSSVTGGGGGASVATPPKPGASVATPPKPKRVEGKFVPRKMPAGGWPKPSARVTSNLDNAKKSAAAKEGRQVKRGARATTHGSPRAVITADVLKEARSRLRATPPQKKNLKSELTTLQGIFESGRKRIRNFQNDEIEDAGPESDGWDSD